MIKTITILMLTISMWVLNAQSEHYFITPSLSPDGKMISFSYQGDIWTVSADGGIARRLTVHPSYEALPQWSPDGEKITFQGSRWGNEDIYVMRSDGSHLIRLTYHSTNDVSPQWDGNDHIVFNTRRLFVQVERETEVYSVPVTGGTPQRILNAVGNDPAPSHNGGIIAFERGVCRISREAYQGPANRQIWTYHKASDKYTQISDFEGQDILPQWAGEDLFFLSARNGRYNIHKISINADGTSDGIAQAMTNLTDEGIGHYDVSDDGQTLVYEQAGKIYVDRLDDEKGAQMVSVKVPADQRLDPFVYEQFSDKASDLTLSPDGEMAAFIVRGELFIKPTDKDKKRSVRLTKHPYREKQPQWVNDSTLLFVSDRDGDFDIYLLKSKGKETDLYKSLQYDVRKVFSTDEEDEDLVISPDGRKLAFRSGRGKLQVGDVSSMGAISNVRTLVDGWDIPGDISWSPDSKWLAYAYRDLSFNREIYIHAADGSGSAVNVSLHPRSDERPVWSADGSKLAFLSTRNNGDQDVWFVWLRKSDWEKTKRDWEEDKDDDSQKSGDFITIDFEDIHHRIEQVTRLAGNEENLLVSEDGEYFYFTTNGGGRQGSSGEKSLMKVKWDGKDLETMVSNIDLDEVSLKADADMIYAVDNNGKLLSVNVTNDKKENLSFTAKMTVDRIEERKQIFEEGWRRLRDGFYDPEYHGKDWASLKAQYYDRCINASTQRDFQSAYNNMLGQLNASHMGLRGVTEEPTQEERTGLIGAEVRPVRNGVKVISIISESPADRTESELMVGDLITTVNGSEIKEGDNFYMHLAATSDERTLLEVVGSNGARRTVIIRPSSSLRNELYESWVKDRKALTEKYSDGKLGYIHIRGMNWTSFERFERELTASGLGKEGLVIDVRYNGGGWTTDMLMTVLNVRQHSYTIPIGAAASLEAEKSKFRESYPFGERLPFSGWTKPSIALCNQSSYSNAEIFSHAYKHLGIGTLVGMPTFGAVISTGASRLIDGSYVRMPYRAWYVKATDQNMEHGPAVPDIIVENTPDSKFRGEDEQLRKAVEALLNQIESGGE